MKGGGALGGVAYKDRARPPPRGRRVAVLAAVGYNDYKPGGLYEAHS